MLPKDHFATVYAKPAGRPLVDTFITEVSQETLILFPWDSESQFVHPVIGIGERVKVELFPFNGTVVYCLVIITV